MSSNPSEFAKRVLEAFETAGRATDEEVGDAGGPSTTTLAKYRKVASGEMTMAEPRGDVLRRIDRAAGWKTGSARALWREGREPDPYSKASMDAMQSKPGRAVRVHDLNSYVEWLAERLTEVEERLDLLEAGRPADTDAGIQVEVVEDIDAENERLLAQLEPEVRAKLEREVLGRVREEREKVQRVSAPSRKSDHALAAHQEEVSIEEEQAGGSEI